jgi:hypothetical protein
MALLELTKLFALFLTILTTNASVKLSFWFEKGPYLHIQHADLQLRRETPQESELLTDLFTKEIVIWN